MSILRISIMGTFMTTVPALAATRYVKPAGTGDCTSWTNACSLQQALSASGLVNNDEIWVAEGTYQTTITLIPNVKIIGGFSGTTETSASQSNPTTYPTVLDGGGSAPVVTSVGDGMGSVLRGFRIKNGACQRALTDPENIGGGGLYAFNSSAVFVQCEFDTNTALYRGAAAFIDGSSSPWFINCTFRENGTGSDGPSADSNARPWAGGAIFVNKGSPAFMNCLFYKNKSLDGAAIFNHNGSPEVVNCTFAGNRAANGYGGAIHDEWGRSIIRNCIFWNNSAFKGANQVYAAPGWTSGVTYSNVQGGWPGATNLNVDPQFVNEAGTNYRLGPTSPCADQGRHTNPMLPNDFGDLNWNLNTTEATPLDILLAPRRYNIKVDLGAFERQTKPSTGGPE